MSITEMKLFLNIAPDFIAGLLIILVFLIVLAFKMYGKDAV